MYVYNIYVISSCVKDNKFDWVWYLFRPKNLGLQYTLRFLRFFTFFFENPKNVTFYVFCLASHVFSNYGHHRQYYCHQIDIDCQLFLGLGEGVVISSRRSTPQPVNTGAYTMTATNHDRFWRPQQWKREKPTPNVQLSSFNIVETEFHQVGRHGLWPSLSNPEYSTWINRQTRGNGVHLQDGVGDNSERTISCQIGNPEYVHSPSVDALHALKQSLQSLGGARCCV